MRVRLRRRWSSALESQDQPWAGHSGYPVHVRSAVSGGRVADRLKERHEWVSQTGSAASFPWHGCHLCDTGACCCGAVVGVFVRSHAGHHPLRPGSRWNEAPPVSNMTSTTTGTTGTTPSMPSAMNPTHPRPVRRLSTETKPSFKTTEFFAYVATVIAIAIASQTIGNDTDAANGDYFRADRAFLYITIVTVGYLLSRGLAKSGSRDFYDDDRNNH